MRALRLVFIAAGGLLGCNSILGIDNEYKLEDSGASASDAAEESNAHAAPGVSKQSCAPELTCGNEVAKQSCCAGDRLEGGEFIMGCTVPEQGDYDEYPQHSAKVTSFRLDAYEVTVGRFRKFVDAFGDGWRPMVGAGKHPLIDGSFWQEDWYAKLPPTREALIENLKCITYKNTWSDSINPDRENYPINCVNWYESFAFCIWDGGRLPTEAEWEYAAKGGTADRTYPWGSEDADCAHVRMAECEETPDGGVETTPFVAVGSREPGKSLWGHYDLAGSMWEWTFDGYDDEWYKKYPGNNCQNCANVARGPRTDRGGGFYETEARLFRSTYRGKDFPENRNDWLGFRCARDDP
ncbi:MAG: formylglycine-generating enzyme family protein [Deltaproteobacteria bacterium]|nr:formylglycine-generating enzyme family protein [Deltaproteobacteria bacterium]